MTAFVKAYEALGFRLAIGDALVEGLGKVALFGIDVPDGATVPTHAALQLETGQWTSKLGDFEDISHDTVDGVSGPIYGKPFFYLERARTSTKT